MRKRVKTLKSVEKRQCVLERFLWFSNVFVRFHSFSNVFVRFWTFWDVFERFWTFFNVFGRVQAFSRYRRDYGTITLEPNQAIQRTANKICM